MTGRLAAAALALCACAAPARIVREGSAARKPDWIAHPPQDGETAHFVGLSSAAETLEAGQRAAISDALAQAARFIGSAIEAKSSSYLDDVRQDIAQQIQLHAAAKLRGCAMVDWYYERITRVDASFSLTKYDVYVLIRYDRKEADDERRRQARQGQDAEALALRRFDDARAASSRGQNWRAAELYAQAGALLRGVDGAVALSAAVKEAAARVRAALHAYTYDVDVSGPPQAARAFRDGLIGALSKKGYALDERSAALRLGGEVALAKRRALLGQQIYSAEGRIAARRAEGGPAVATVAVQAKGLHADPVSAAVNAAQDAGAQAGEGMGAALSASFDRSFEIR